MTAVTRSYPAGAMPESLTWQSLSLLRYEWPYLFRGDNRLRTRPFGGPDDDHLARTDGEVLLSYADVVRAEATRADRPIRIRGLSNVVTSRPYRGEGHASAVVAAACQLIDASEADLAVLFCESELARFYAARGWQPAPAGGIQCPTAAPVIMMRPASERGAEIVADLGHQPLTLPFAW